MFFVFKCGIVWVKTNDNDNCQFYDHFWPFFCQLYVYLLQNWGSDSHFGMLTGRKSNWFKGYDIKCKYIYFLFFAIFYKNTLLRFFNFVSLLYQLRFRVLKHLKMSVWISFLWKITIQLAKKWPDMVVKCSSISCYILKVSQEHPRHQFTSEAIILEPIIL